MSDDFGDRLRQAVREFWSSTVFAYLLFMALTMLVMVGIAWVKGEFDPPEERCQRVASKRYPRLDDELKWNREYRECMADYREALRR